MHFLERYCVDLKQGISDIEQFSVFQNSLMEVKHYLNNLPDEKNDDVILKCAVKTLFKIKKDGFCPLSFLEATYHEEIIYQLFQDFDVNIIYFLSQYDIRRKSSQFSIIDIKKRL